MMGKAPVAQEEGDQIKRVKGTAEVKWNNLTRACSSFLKRTPLDDIKAAKAPSRFVGEWCHDPYAAAAKPQQTCLLSSPFSPPPLSPPMQADCHSQHAVIPPPPTHTSSQPLPHLFTLLPPSPPLTNHRHLGILAMHSLQVHKGVPDIRSVVKQKKSNAV